MVHCESGLLRIIATKCETGESTERIETQRKEEHKKFKERE